MKKLIWLLLVAPLFGQQVNNDVIPASGGLNLGHSNQRWNMFAQNVDISGTCTFNGSPCAFGGATATAGGGLVVAPGGTLGLISSCSSNQGLAWNGTTWVCGVPGASLNNTFSGNNNFTGSTTVSALTSATTTLSGITGSTQCLHVNSSGLISGVGSDCGTATLPTGALGNPLVNNNGSSTYTAVTAEIHSTGFAGGTTLAAMIATCPAFPAPCHIILDPTPPGTSIPVATNGSYPLVIGAGSSPSTSAHITVEGRGATLSCTQTGLTVPITTDCLHIGQWGSLRGFNEGNTTNGGNVITSVASATYRYIVADDGVASTTGFANYLQQRFDYEGWQIIPSGTSIITGGILALIAVEGNASVRHFSILGIKNTANIYIADGPSSGDNNSLLFSDGANVCANNAGCVPLWITTAQTNGNGINMTFHEVGFGNGPGGAGCASGSGCMLNIDGSFGGLHNAAFLNDILFDGGYMEMSGTYPAWSTSGDVPGTTTYALGNAIKPTSNNPSAHYYVVTTAGTPGASQPVWNGAGCTAYTQGSTCADGSVVWTDNGTANPSHFIEMVNARDVDLRGLDINAGTTDTCLTISGSTTGRIHLMGRVAGGHCTTAILKNNVTGYSSTAGPWDMDYLYTGAQPAGGMIVDGDLSTSGLNQIASKNFAGTCAMSTSTSCTFTISGTYSSTPICFASEQGAGALAGSCALSGSTVTITAASSNSGTWGAELVGNPN